jgi:hypothetical protein
MAVRSVKPRDRTGETDAPFRVALEILMTFQTNAIRAAFQIMIPLMLNVAVSAGDFRMGGNLILVMLGSGVTGQAGGVFDRINAIAEVETEGSFNRSPGRVALRAVVLKDAMRVREFAAFIDEVVSAGASVDQPQQTGRAQPERAPPDTPPEAVRSLVELDLYAFRKFPTCIARSDISTWKTNRTNRPIENGMCRASQ